MAKKGKNYPSRPRSENEGNLYELNLKAYIRQHKGQYIRADDGSFHVIMQGRRIPISFDRNNHHLAKLMLEACQVTSLSAGAQAAIQRLQIIAHTNASNITLKNFSGLSGDQGRLYIPVQGGKLLTLTAEGTQLVANGDNEDKLWIEHPEDCPFRYKAAGGSSDGLALFERLVVDTQSCRTPAMRWLVAMHEGLFPYVREICRARFLLVHIGGTQQGKTTGAERFTLLQGLGEVKGDYSVAALANMRDIGLLVMDNREQANFTQQLIDFCLFLATGAEWGRSSTDGQVRKNSARPAAVITSIEGAWKAELQARCVEIPYEISGTKVDRDDVSEEILLHRHEMLSAIAPVFQMWLRIRKEGSRHFRYECPRPNFERHFSVLVDCSVPTQTSPGNRRIGARRSSTGGASNSAVKARTQRMNSRLPFDNCSAGFLRCMLSRLQLKPIFTTVESEDYCTLLRSEHCSTCFGGVVLGMSHSQGMPPG